MIKILLRRIWLTFTFRKKELVTSKTSISLERLIGGRSLSKRYISVNNKLLELIVRRIIDFGWIRTCEEQDKRFIKCL